MTPSGGHHTWTVDEVRKFEDRHAIGTMARLALAIFLFTGIRRSDAGRLGRQHARDGWFKFRQWKNRNRHPVDIEIPILPELEEIIRQSQTGDLTYIVTTYGMPFADAGFGNKFREWCDGGLAAVLRSRTPQGQRDHRRGKRRDSPPAHVDLRLADPQTG